MIVEDQPYRENLSASDRWILGLIVTSSWREDPIICSRNMPNDLSLSYSGRSYRALYTHLVAEPSR